MAKNQVNGFEYVQSSGGIEEYKMGSNGLTVLLMEDHSAPVATFMVTYHVGSRNEAVGYTGSTHLLEHLMFKGSHKFNKKKGTAIWTVLQDVGARINATTWMDRTNYFELLPSEHLETAIAIEADRMRHAFINDEDRQPEMTVVRNEFERGENDPFDVLDKNIWATAYQAHPYHHSTIGWRSDIENVSTERLKEFYNTYYWPNNSTVTIIGDFETDKALRLVKDYFGKHKMSPAKIPKMYTTEPKQEGPRRLSIRRAGETGIVGIAHKSPTGLEEDTYSIQVLSKILGGGKSSRLYRKIVDKGLATGMFMWDFPFKDNGLFVTYVFMTPGTDHAEVEKIVLDEYEIIKEKGVAKNEIKRAKAQINSEMAFSRDGSYSIASALNEAIAIGNWKFYTTYKEKIMAVTVKDIKRVANKYLNETQSTTGYFIPENQGASKGDKPGSAKINKPLNVRPENMGIPERNQKNRRKQSQKRNELGKPKSLSTEIITSTQINGLQLKTMKTPIKDVVTLTGSILGGGQFSGTENRVVADLTADMLDEGTTKHTKFEISELLESVGANISFSSDKYRVRFNAHCLTKDLPLVIDLLGEQLMFPAFQEADLKNLKKRRIGSLKKANENTQTRAAGTFKRLLYPKGHPNYSVPIKDEISDIEKTTVDDLKKFHKNYGMGNMNLVAVGDVDKKTLELSLIKAFGKWKQSNLFIPAKTPKANQVNKVTKYVTIEDKTSADMFLGIPIGIDRDHPDYYTLMVGNYILGGNFSARLMQSVRDEKGLTYGIYSSIQGVNDGADGYWSVWGTFSPDLLKEGKKAAIEQIKMWVKNITEKELKAKKETIIGSYKVGLATTGGLASQILTNAERGDPDSMLDQYPTIIRNVSLDQVNKTIKKYISPDKLVMVVAGSIDKNGKPLSK